MRFIKIILITFIIILPIKVFGACSVDDKIRYLTLASNITTSYDYTEVSDEVTFAITIHNVHKDLVVKDNINNKSYSSSKNDLNNYTISNLKEGTNYAFSVYAKSGDCTYKLLNTIYVNLPKYNKYYKDSVCDGMESYNLCQRWGEIGDISYENFKKKVEEYKKESNVSEEIIEEDDDTIVLVEIVGDFWAKYYLYITLGTIVLLTPIIIIKKRNSYDF